MEGLEAEDRKYKWEITPHPYSTDFDTFVTDDDKEALKALIELSEFIWDGIESDEEKTISVKLNKV